MSAAVRFCAVSLACAPWLTAAGDGPIRKPSFDPEAERVELFEAVDREQLSVRVGVRDAFRSNVFITNETDQPLTVVLPDGVVAVHVLKQFAPPGGVVGANDSRDMTLKGLPPKTYTGSPRCTRVGQYSAMCMGMRTQPCEAGYAGTLASPCTAIPALK